ncbi:MAG: divalent-cation tolerance protein CutA [Calditrichia bacterium]
MKNDFILAFCTVPDLNTAEKIGEVLVEEKLAACCNIIPGLTSIYRWKEKVEKEPELLLIIKSVHSLLTSLEDRIKEMHPYEVPEIIAMPLMDGSNDYLKWVEENVDRKQA